MKKFIIIIAIAIIAILSQTQFGSICYAKIITVSNHTGDIAMYSSLPTAISSATAGDSIYVFPSPTSYGNITINKKLTLMGAGYYSSSTYTTNIDYISLENCSQSNFYGISISGITCSTYIRKLIIARCFFKVNVTINGSNITLINNVFYGTNIYLDLGNSDSVVVSNNIFCHKWIGFNVDPTLIRNSSKSSVIISNNLFFNYNSNAYCFSDISNAIVDNNIFYKENPYGLSKCFTNNNLVFKGTDSLPYGDNSGENNINSKDPEFVNMQSLNYFTFSGDYHLKDTSPGKNAGTDSTDVGIYGSSESWPEVTGYTGKPPLPRITNMNLLNRVVGQESKVRVKIQATKAK
jgi:hypothetical protein